MRRELRRHPVQGTAKAARATKPSRATAASGAGTGQRTASAGRSPLPAGGLRSLLTPQWFHDVWSELKKVTWPTWQQTRDLTVVVVVVAAVLGLFLGGLDYTFNWLLERTLLR